MFLLSLYSRCFSILISRSLCLLLLNLARCKMEFCLQFCVPFLMFIHFFPCVCPWLQTGTYIGFCSYIFKYFYPWLYILNVRTSSNKAIKYTVSSSTYSVIYSEKYARYLGKFLSLVWSVLKYLFRLPLVAKTCAGGKVVR